MPPIPTVDAFLAAYPEFDGMPEDLCGIKLAQAARRTNEKVFQSTDLAQDAVMLRAAILIMRSPGGRKMRLANPDQIFTWEYELRQLQTSATIGLRVF